MIDASSPEHASQAAAVHEVLEQIGAQDIPLIEVFNKIDLLDEDERARFRERFPAAEFVSAESGEGIEELVRRIDSAAGSVDTLMDVIIPYSKGDLVSLAHERCSIISEQHEEGGTHRLLQVPPEYTARYAPFLIES